MSFLGDNRMSDGNDAAEVLRGEDARQLILDQIEAHNGGVLGALRGYEPAAAVRAWHGTIRAIEEFINVPLFAIDDDAVVRWLLSVRLDESFLATRFPLCSGLRCNYLRFSMQVLSVASAS